MDFLFNSFITKHKKSVQWNEFVAIFETFAKEDYDRKIDAVLIQQNLKEYREYKQIQMIHACQLKRAPCKEDLVQFSIAMKHADNLQFSLLP